MTTKVVVSAPARLHLGFLDLHGGLGRRFGSLGITIDTIATRLSATLAATSGGEGPSLERALRYHRILTEQCGLTGGVHLRIDQAIPEHAGLGSGTQMALAVGLATARLGGLALSPRQIAGLLNRGARSGIGVAAFEGGGVVLDGGSGPDGAVPPAIARLDFPENWRLLLVLDRIAQGLHGAAEVAGFQALPPFPPEQAGHLCRLMLMVLLPALKLVDIEGVGRAVGELQRVMAEQFAAGQGGAFTSPHVADAVGWLASQGIQGVGQSSWGPTGFAIVGSAAQAEQLCRGARQRESSRVAFAICRGRNTGGELSISQ